MASSVMTSKTVLITGCSDGGIGSALAKEYAKVGCRVLATARNLATMTELRNNDSIVLFTLDICDHQSIRDCRTEVCRVFGGRLDLLVNNAGVAYSSSGIEMDVARCREVFETNLFGVMEMNRAFGSMLVASHGTICSTGSIAGLVPVPFGGIYNSSKAALAMYNDCLRMELEPLGVKVINFVTGQVQSNIVENSARHYNMAADSYYKSIENDIERVRKSSQGRKSISRDCYATSVVAQSLRKDPPPRIYRGGLATTVWLLSCLFPYSIIAHIMSRRSGLHQLSRKRDKTS